MNDPGSHVCTICAEEKPAGENWFLIAENRWEDKLRILHWDENLARQVGVYAACSAMHVQELVIHWMTTGSLDYPFARADMAFELSRPRREWTRDVGRGGGQQIVELAIHWESMRRVLRESPESLKTILDAMLGALRQETSDREFHDEMEGQSLPVFAHEI